MNKTHNIVWSVARNMYVVASEFSRGDSRMKTQVKTVATMVLLALSPLDAQAVFTPDVTDETVAGEAGEKGSQHNTYVNGSLLVVGTGNTLGSGGGLELASGATFDLNGMSQSFDYLYSDVGSTLNLDGGELTLGRDSGYSSRISGIVTGSGLLDIYGSLDIYEESDLSGLSATIDIEQNAEVHTWNAALGTGSIVVDGVLYMDASAGDLSNNLSGSGDIWAISALTISGENGDFGGTWTIDRDSSLTVADVPVLGTGNVVDGGTLYLGGTEDWALNSGNVISDYYNYDGEQHVEINAGKVVKQDANIITIAHANTYSGGTLIAEGTLNASDVGALGMGDVDNYAMLNLNAAGEYVLANLTTFSGDTTTLAAGSTLNTGVFTQQDGSVLNINLGEDASSPIITADSASLDGTLNITGVGNIQEPLSHDPYTFTLIDTDGTINGDFDDLTIAGMKTRAIDFLTVAGRINPTDNSQYELATSLSWYADENSAVTDAHGTFTLSDPDGSFTLNTILADVAPNDATRWDGSTLTKAGDGTLILKAVNTYSGNTLVNGGTLIAGVDNSLGEEGGLELESGSTFDLDGMSQNLEYVYGDVGSTLDLDGGKLTLGGDSYMTSWFNGIVTGGGLLDVYGDLIIGQTSDLSGLSATIDIEQYAVVEAQTLELGSGRIVADGLLLIESASGTLDNNISGSGDVWSTGDTTLSGDNSGFSGSWTLRNYASFRVADASALGTGNVVDGGTLYLGGTEDWALNSGNVISDYYNYDGEQLVEMNAGKVVKQGANAITIAHANTYSGGTLIAEGTLNASDVGALGMGDVDNYAMLNLNAAGEYVLANLTTFSGGTTSLAASATLSTTVLDQQEGSVLSIDLGADASSPIITADSVSLNGTLNITGIGNIQDPLTHAPYAFTLIDADSAISGDFDDLTVAGIEAKETDFLTVDSRVVPADNSQYELTASLSWYADENNAATDAHGIFTLSDPDGSFTLNTVLADVDPNSVTGWDGKTLTKAGDGTLILNTANTYSGETRVTEGTLWLTDTGVIGVPDASGQGAVNVDSGATFGGSGVVNGDVYNSGKIAMSHEGETGNTLTINGNYTGDNGNLYFNTQLGDDSSPTDKLVISGDTSGNTTVYVANVNGKGAQTKNGIEVIDVGGQSEGVFTQGNQVQIGLYEYRLYEDEGDWYLRSQSTVPPEPDDSGDVPVTPQYRPDIGAYLGNQWMVRNLQMQTLYDREGSQYHNEDGSVWMRFKAGNAGSQAADGNVDINNNYSQFQLGGDILAWDNDRQSLKVGVMASYINADTDSEGNRGADGSRFSATGNVDGYNLGVYATWFADAQNHQGVYVDSWYQYGFYNNSVSNGDVGSEGYDSTAHAISLETGYRHDIALSNQNTVSLIPQAQATWQKYDADSVIDNNGTRIDDQDSGSWTTRLGLRVDGKLHRNATSMIQPFAEVNWLYTSGDVSVSFDGAEMKQDSPTNRAQAKVGIQANLDSQWSITGQVVGETGSHNYNDLNGSLNLRYSW